MDEAILVLLIVLANGDGRPASLVAGAAREALGQDTRILVEEPAALPDDEDAERLGEKLHASAVAEVRWDDARRDQAHVHLFLQDEHRWFDRDVSFEPDDAPDERDRAVGFLVGAMVRASLPAPEPPPPAPAPDPVIMTPPTPPAAESRAALPVSVRRRVRFAADVAAAGALGIAGAATGLGPSVRALASFGGPFGVQLGGALRFGDVPAAEATSRTVRLGAGGFWRALDGGARRPVELLLSLDALAVHHRVHRDAPELARERWVGGLLLGATVGFRATSALEPFVGLGLEAVFGPTPIRVAEQEVAQLPPFRATSELGIRIHF